MEVKIIKEKENPFFNRRDVTIKILHDSDPTPKTDDVIKEVATQFNVDKSQVVVEFIFTKTGLSESNAKVKILNEIPEKSEESSEETGEKQEKEKAEKEAGEEDKKDEPSEEKSDKSEEKPDEKDDKEESNDEA